MAFWRFIKILIGAIIIFAVVNFFLSNSSPEAHSLAEKISFKFSLPPIYSFESVDFKVGYLLLIAFSLGMIIAALIGGVNAFSRSRELKMKNRTIQELESEIDDLRDTVAREKNILPETKLTEELNRLPDQPEIQ